MKNTSERRQMILDYLLEHRETTRYELSNHFNVSLRTIERDILILSCSYPIMTIQGGGGGIKIANGYRLGMKYLSESQTALHGRSRARRNMCGDALADSTSVRNTATNPRPLKKAYSTQPS